MQLTIAFYYLWSCVMLRVSHSPYPRGEDSYPTFASQELQDQCKEKAAGTHLKMFKWLPVLWDEEKSWTQCCKIYAGSWRQKIGSYQADMITSKAHNGFPLNLCRRKRAFQENTSLATWRVSWFLDSNVTITLSKALDSYEDSCSPGRRGWQSHKALWKFRKYENLHFVMWRLKT